MSLIITGTGTTTLTTVFVDDDILRDVTIHGGRRKRLKRQSLVQLERPK